MSTNLGKQHSWKNYLGILDAHFEKRPDLFFDTGVLSSLKWKNNDSGYFIIVGAKGTGKTAICEFISKESAEEGNLVWRVDEQHRFINGRVTDLGEYPAEIEAILLNLILGHLINIVKENEKSFGDTAKTALKLLNETLLPKIQKRFKEYLDSTTGVTVGGVGWNFEKILSSKSKMIFTNFNIDEYVNALKPCFDKRKIVILFDDVDDVFLGADKREYSAFVEGLIRAARTINLEFENSIHFLVFLKYGVYRSFFDRPNDFDKVKDYILELKWTEENLESMLAKRIADKININEKRKPWQFWGEVFHPKTKESIDRAKKYLIERCPSGPRDLIDFTNRAIESAQRLKITHKDIESCETGFSEARITAIHQDYGSTYRDIHLLVKNAFSKQPKSAKNSWAIKARYSQKEFKDLAYAIRISEHINNVFENAEHEYYRMANPNDLIRIFYTIGFIGYKLPGAKYERFVLDDPKGDELTNAESYAIHKVFWKALGIESTAK
jgi:hypothetical protein